MSWLFSQALVEAYSADTCSDGAQSAPSSGNPTPQAFLPLDRMTAFSRPSQFGMTFKPLTDGLGAAVLMWCQEVSRARTSASQAKEPALTEPAAECGDTWRGSLARFDPATSSWRTAQPSLLEDLGESLVIWPRSGMTADGQCWELPTLGRTTRENEFGFLPTPTANQSLHCSIVAARKEAKRLHRRGQWTLWSLISVMESAESGYLNPEYPEWLMGWPLGWTELKPLATAKSPSVPQQHSNY
jgi:hypothetical protein